jgi:hypothetical protein
MRVAVLLWAAALTAHTRDVPFDSADYPVDDHRVVLRSGGVVFDLSDSGTAPVEIVTPS